MVNRLDANTSEHGAGPAPGAVEALIERFGGLRPMADKLGVPVSTVQGWKKRGAIPANRQQEIRAAMEKLHLGDPDADLEGVFRHDEAAPNNGNGAAHPAETVPVSAAAAPPPDDPPLPAGNDGAVDGGGVQVAAAEETPVEETPVEETPVAPAPAEVAPAPAENIASPLPPAELSAPAPAEKRQEAPVTDTPSLVAPVSDDRPQSSQGAGAAIAAAVLAVVGAAVSVTAPLWSHEYLQRSVNVAVIEKRTADVEGALGVAATQRTALAERIGGVEKTLAALEARVAKAPAVAGVLAARDLRAALAGGAPFAMEAAAVRASGLAGTEEEALLAALSPYAEKGVPTALVLNERFAWTASSVVGSGLAGMLPSVSSDIPARVWTWASGMASGVAGAVGDAAGSVDVSGLAEALRLKDIKEPSASGAVAAPAPVVAAPPPAAAVPAPVPAPVVAPEVPAGPSATALMAEAGGHLRRGDLAAAVETVARLEGPSAALAAPWLTDARARLAADKAAAAIAERAAKALR